MKKISILMVNILLAFSLAACASGNSPTNTQGDLAPSATALEAGETRPDDIAAFTVLSASGKTSHKENSGVKNGEVVTTGSGAINNQGQEKNIGTIDVTLGYGMTSLGNLRNVVCLEATEGMGYYAYAGIFTVGTGDR